MNLKSIGYIFIVLSVAGCCFLCTLIYFIEPSTVADKSSPQFMLLSFSCLATIGALVVGGALMLFSNLTEKQRLGRESQLTKEEQGRKFEEQKNKEDEIINKWINKKP